MPTQPTRVPSSPAAAPATRAGLLYALAAYGVWGFFPLYFKALSAVTPLEVLAHRIVWSVLTLTAILSVTQRWRGVRAAFGTPALLRPLVATTLLIAVNWLVFIYAVTAGQVLQSSLGYFINPLVSALLGVVFLHERLTRTQQASLILAAAGVAWLTLHHGTFPWIALTLALSFGLYGLLRKVVAVDALTGLAVETLLLFPCALLYLAWLGADGRSAFLAGPPGVAVLLACSGVLTSVPLLWFAAAAKRLRLVTVGLMQYQVPTLHFVMAVWLFHEPFDSGHLLSFALIWTGLALYSGAALRRRLSGG